MEHTNYNDVHCEETIVNVPFSWEHKPGLSKVTTHGQTGTSMVLQPPPCSSSGSGSDHRYKVEEESQILRAVQTSLRISSFRMESQKEEDPFVEAYKKCTQSPFIHEQSDRVQKNIRSWPTIRNDANPCELGLLFPIPLCHYFPNSKTKIVYTYVLCGCPLRLCH
ncbi:hypothetical protein AAZX31_14G088900 [Glycine max]